MSSMSSQADGNRGWTLLTNHGRVLLMLAADPQARLRDVAFVIGITERTVQGIISDLAQEGYIRRVRDGRRNIYSVDLDKPFRHPAESGHSVGELYKIFSSPESEG